MADIIDINEFRKNREKNEEQKEPKDPTDGELYGAREGALKQVEEIMKRHNLPLAEKTKIAVFKVENMSHLNKIRTAVNAQYSQNAYVNLWEQVKDCTPEEVMQRLLSSYKNQWSTNPAYYAALLKKLDTF